jgi:hypothetical protein
MRYIILVSIYLIGLIYLEKSIGIQNLKRLE